MKELHEALLKVKKSVDHNPYFPICDSLRQAAPYDTFESDVSYRAFWELLYTGFTAWPDFSGNSCFPVCELQSETAKKVYEALGDKGGVARWLYYNLAPWADTPYGRKRRELLDFLIEYTKPQ